MTLSTDETERIRWKRCNGGYILGGGPEGRRGKEAGVLFRIRRLRHLKIGKTILEVGCGFCAHLRPLKNRGLFTIGMEPKRNFLLEAKPVDNAHSYIQTIGENIPVCDKTFDLALVLELLEHVIKPERVLQEVKRVLKPNGLLLLSTPNRFYPFETHGIQVGRTQIENLLGVGIPFFSFAPQFIRRRFERARIYTAKDLVIFLRKGGFVPIKIEFMMPPLDRIEQTPLVLAARKALLSLGRLAFIKNLGVHIIIISARLHSD